MGATHLVVTHMDEVVSAARLWPCVLRGGLTPLFASHGQNVTSDFSEDILRLLLEKTFPQAIAL
jgi:flagellar biosynthesis protein FlhF